GLAKGVAVPHVDLAAPCVNATGDHAFLPTTSAAAVARIDGEADESAAVTVRDCGSVEHPQSPLDGWRPCARIAAAHGLPGRERLQQLLLNQHFRIFRCSRRGGEQKDEKSETGGHGSSRK